MKWQGLGIIEMSLTIKTLTITDKQKAILHRLEYYGNLNLTASEAAILIIELFEQQRLARKADEQEIYDIFETYYDGKLFL